MKQWKWAAASCRGTAHAQSSTRKQDALCCFATEECPGVLVAVVSDGAGSAAKGGEGAALVCRTVASEARAYLIENEELPGEDPIWDWLDRTRDRIAEAARNLELSPRDFAATCVAVLSDGASTTVAHVGDGAAVVRSLCGKWKVASWPEQGEYASTTYFVTDDPGPRLRISRISEEVNALAVFTDGMERLVLDLASSTPHEPFFSSMITPVEGGEQVGSNRMLSRQLWNFLNGDRVNERTDDDKTLVLAARV